MTLTTMYLNSYPKRASSRFDTLPTIDGYDVIAVDTGRPVDHCSNEGEARERCLLFNTASKAGRKALATALGATDK